jgi:hypothetical protein
MPRMSDQLLTIAAFRDLPEALLAKGKLESAEIDCMLIDEETIRIDWLYSNAIGGIKLKVYSEDAEAALDILATPIPEQFSAEQVGEAYEQPRCPGCASLDVSAERAGRKLMFGTWLVLGFPLPLLGKEHFRCESCGAAWEEVPDAQKNTES